MCLTNLLFNTFHNTSFLVGVALILSNAGFGQFKLTELSNPNDSGISSDTLRKMTTHFHKLVDEKKIAGIQTGIISNGKLVHFDSYGYASIEKKDTLNEKSIFRIFSMTKPIVSVALMQLYEQGKFKLEDPLYKYIPEFKSSYVLKDSTLIPAKNPIRIIDLLTHSSGYNYGATKNSRLNEYYSKAALYTSRTNAEFVKKLSTVPLQFEPGTNWQYGLSTNICGYLIEVLSQKSLNQYLLDSVLQPLKMNDTHFQLPQEKIRRFTTGYRWNKESGLQVSEESNSNGYVNEVTIFNGGGGLVSTTFDYLKFCQMILNKGELNGIRIVQENTINLILSDHLEATRSYQKEKLRLPYGEASFGLGFSIRGKNLNSLEEVYGWGGAAGTYFKIDFKNNLVYTMMIQILPYRQLGLRQKIQNFVDGSIRK